jgi:protein SCO1/2
MCLWLCSAAALMGAAEPSGDGSSSTAGGQAGKAAGPGRHPLLGYSFTNELGRAVRLEDFRGQALAITFFFTRCPRPEFCPRLSKNFQEASLKLAGMTDAPTNWHFLSVTFDPEFDTPAVLRAYGNAYHYDSNHWSFLTGPPDKIEELTRLSQVGFKRQGGVIDHDFRTLVIDSAGSLQMAFPVSGDLTKALVSEVLKAAAVKPEEK